MTDKGKLSILASAARLTLDRINIRNANIDGLGDFLEWALLEIGEHPAQWVFSPESLVLINPRQRLIEQANTDDGLFRALCEEDWQGLEAIRDESDYARGL